ncbi:MAG: hypothetical protein AABY58_03750 [Nitrospirota bacterium]
MREVPFYSNTEDNKSCYEAVLRMILKYYLPDKDFSWDELNKITGKKERLLTWPQYSYISMKNLGFEVKVISAFDYDKFVKNGIKYIEEEYGKEIAKEQEKNCDIAYEIENVKKLKNLIIKEERIPDIKDICDLLTNNYLVKCGVNSKKLAGLDGYASHSILIFEFDSKSLTLHDPGLPSRKSFRIDFDTFNQAWSYPNERAKDIAAFKLLKNNVI